MTKTFAAEDSPRSRRVRENAPSPYGSRVATVSDRNEGVAAARSRALNGVVAAPAVPAMDGLGFIRALRQTPPDRRAPIVMLAAEHDKGLRRQAKAAGPSGCHGKLFKPEHFIAANKKAPR